MVHLASTFYPFLTEHRYNLRKKVLVAVSAALYRVLMATRRKAMVSD